MNLNINRNSVLALCWAVWEFKKSQEPSLSWDKYLNFFGDFVDFELKLNNLVNQLEGNLQLSDFSIKRSLLKRAAQISFQYDNANIKSIVRDDFKNFPSLKNLRSVNWFFYMGDINVLDFEIEQMVSVIGSRRTSSAWKEWVLRVLPKDKVVISGLATGADVLGHEVAIENNQKIVIFPGIDLFHLSKKVTGEKSVILDYAIRGNGVVLSNIFPNSPSFSKTIFLNRNRWMAQMSSSTYVVYFDGVSGTLGQMIETLKLKRNIFTSENVIKINEEFLDMHQAFANWRQCIKAI